MAAVLDAMVPYVNKLIAGMAEEEVNMLLGVSGEITKLEDNTESIKAFLANAERRRITEQSVQRWVNKLKDAMYDATDILDLCQLEADKRKGSEGGSMDEKKAPSCCRSLLFCLRNPVFAHKIGSRIKELNQRLEDIRKGADQFNFNINLGSYQDRQMTSQTEHSSHKAISEFDESAIVGKNVENDMKLLIQELITDDNNNIKVVSICGMGGIGKTTLAQKIFQETTIQEHFKTRIWLSFGKHFDNAELLRSAIKHAGRDHGEERDMSLLVRTLTDALSASKFLVVMDDIWSDEAWSNVLCVPIRNASRNKPGSRVLVTTRLKDLASKMGESFHQHHVSPLDEEDAWSLLKKQLTPNQVVGIEQLKNIGMDILEKCDGLPVAIKVIGGLLSTRYPSELELDGLEKVPACWMAEKAMISKAHLNYLELNYNSHSASKHTTAEPRGDQEEANEKQQLQQEVLEKLRPPTCIENLRLLGGYVGCHLPNWMCAPASAEFKSLRYLKLENLPCCTHLPDGLRCLPSLEMLSVKNAPAVKQIGPKFQSSLAPSASAAHPPFPKLRELQLIGLCEWEEWDWNHDGCEEEQGDAKAVIAMPYLERLYIRNCKLRCLPLGLTNNKRHALRKLYLYGITNLASVENFPSVVELDVFDCPKLKRINDLFMLHKIRIVRCPNLEVLEGVPALDSLRLDDTTMEALPAYLPAVYPRYLSLYCNKKLYGSISSPGSSEWNKISHIGKRDFDYIQD